MGRLLLKVEIAGPPLPRRPLLAKAAQEVSRPPHRPDLADKEARERLSRTLPSWQSGRLFSLDKVVRKRLYEPTLENARLARLRPEAGPRPVALLLSTRLRPPQLLLRLKLLAAP